MHPDQHLPNRRRRQKNDWMKRVGLAKPSKNLRRKR
jgi:hypothetical protein